jgi:small subunit ribosomal protein S20
MAWHASTKKRLRRDTKKRVENKSQIHALRTCLKKARETLVSGIESVACVRGAQSALAVSAAKGLIHRNAAARKTSRMMKKMHAQQLSAQA